MGRNAQPISVIKAKGKSHHLTAKEIERRKKAEIKIGDRELIAPTYVKNDIVAFEKWKELINIYQDIDFISAADSGMMARYCKHYSEYISIMDRMQKIEKLEIDWDDYSMSLDIVIQDGIEKILKLEPLDKLEKLLNKKSELLTKLEDRLFLNPVSRIKNVPKKEKEEIDPSVSMFGG